MESGESSQDLALVHEMRMDKFAIAASGLVFFASKVKICQVSQSIIFLIYNYLRDLFPICSQK